MRLEPPPFFIFQKLFYLRLKPCLFSTPDKYIKKKNTFLVDNMLYFQWISTLFTFLNLVFQDTYFDTNMIYFDNIF